MGDFCVSGFHSHIPIESSDKVVAIICKHTTNALSNCPCYLKGILVPICMPVVAYMGDYGSIEEDEYEENETTRILQELTGKSFSDISESLAQVSEYKMDDKQYPEFYDLFKTFNSCERYYEEYTGTRYHIIYEHYDVYKAMTFEWDYVKQAVKSFFVPVLELLKKNKINAVINPFRDFGTSSILTDMMDSMGIERRLDFENEEFRKKARLAFDIDSRIRKLYDSIPENVKVGNDEDDTINLKSYLPGRILYNFSNNDFGWLSLYNSIQLDIENSLDEIVSFCAFCIQLDNCEYGHFYLSTSAGQSWHHDKQMWKERLNVLKVYESIINEKLENAAND